MQEGCPEEVTSELNVEYIYICIFICGTEAIIICPVKKFWREESTVWSTV